MRAALLAAVLGVFPAFAHGPVVVFAAGSLRAPLTEIAEALNAKGGTVRLVFGASGLLKERIEKAASAEDRADLFASANTEHPEALVKAGKAGKVTVFARNELCALVSPGKAVTTESLLAAMLEPGTKLGTSTPKADPSGDYAFQLFDKAEALAGKAKADILRGRALLLTGGPASPPPPANRSVYAELVSSGQADIFLTYCTNAEIAIREQPMLKRVALPKELSVGADYGLTVIKGGNHGADLVADFILGPEGRRVLAKHGFGLPTK